MTKSPSSLTFFLPLPSPMLSPNRAPHWAQKAAAKKEGRAAAKREGLRVLDGAPPPMWAKARFVATRYSVGKGKAPDPDNFLASLKSYLDGLADAGIVENDRGLWPERPVYVRTDKMPRIEITVTQETEE